MGIIEKLPNKNQKDAESKLGAEARVNAVSPLSAKFSSSQLYPKESIAAADKKLLEEYCEGARLELASRLPQEIFGSGNADITKFWMAYSTKKILKVSLNK